MLSIWFSLRSRSNRILHFFFASGLPAFVAALDALPGDSLLGFAGGGGEGGGESDPDVSFVLAGAWGGVVSEVSSFSFIMGLFCARAEPGCYLNARQLLFLVSTGCCPTPEFDSAISEASADAKDRAAVTVPALRHLLCGEEDGATSVVEWKLEFHTSATAVRGGSRSGF